MTVAPTISTMPAASDSPASSAAPADVTERAASRPELFPLIVSTLTLNVLSLALPVMTLQVYDRILPNPQSHTIWVLVSGVCVVLVLEAALRLARTFMMEWTAAVGEHRLSCRALNHLLDADLSRTGPRGVGERLHGLSAIRKLNEFENGQVWTVAIELCFVGVLLGLIVYIAGWLAVAPLAVLALFAVCAVLNGRRLRRTLSRRDEVDDRRYNFLIEALEGIHTLKAFALEQRFQRRYERLHEDASVANFRMTETATRTFNTSTVFANMMIIAVVAAGAPMVLDGAMSSGALIATVLLSGRIMQPIQRALALWARYQDYLNARARVDDIFATPTIGAAASAGNATGELPDGGDIARTGTLALRDVRFRYGEADAWLLNGVDLTLEAGETVAISGVAGSGKTTLINLIAGIMPPTEGEVLVSGVPVATIPASTLAHHVGTLMTEGVMFRGTIRDNITRFGASPEADARAAANLLKVDRDVARLPAGFDTRLAGNTTDTIAPGLAQRIAMARALAPKPSILLFDHADKSLDHDGYNLVFAVLNRLRGHVAMILMSDDRNITAMADRHFSLAEGRLIPADMDDQRVVARPFRELAL